MLRAGHPRRQKGFDTFGALLGQLGLPMTLEGPVPEDEGMRVFEYWGGEYHPLEELIAEMKAIKEKNNQQDHP